MVQVLILGMLAAGAIHAAGPSSARLLRQPDISREELVFVYAGDLWTAPRNGGAANRLTATAEAESVPKFSPDGKWIAFARSGDVYVIPAEGGEERRLTWHPSSDRAVGWTPDGRKLLVHSDRLRGALTQSPHLFLLPIEGGSPEPLPIPRATHGSFSPDGQRIAYGPNPEITLWTPWKRYRGGSLGYIAIYDLERNRYDELPRGSANDVCPMWHGDAIYFASDRDRVMNLYRYDLASKRTERLTGYAEWDVKNPSLGPDAIVYENGGGLSALDLRSHSVREISVSLPPEALPGSDERAKWRQALEDAWRVYADHAFSPSPVWQRIKPRYEELMSWAAHSSDAEYVLTEMLGEACQSHVILIGSEKPDGARPGLLGADFRLEGTLYRIAKIYRGADADGKTHGPLAKPGLSVNEGDYLLAVDGKPVRGPVDVYAAFGGLAGKEVKLTVNSAPAEAGKREITVRPISDERSLRYMEWIRANRARVAEATGGRVGYVHVFNVEDDGVEAFRNGWMEQRTRVAAMIVDVRNNSGGVRTDDIFDWIALKPSRLMYDKRGRVPPFGRFIDGPKVMIANDQAVSGGDELAAFFKRDKVGPLVGNRTFGGMIGSGDAYKITGGWVLLVPQYGFYRPDTGEWYPENYGVAPDYVVELKPDALTGGRDPQLEKAIELATEALKTYTKIPDPPPYTPTR